MYQINDDFIVIIICHIHLNLNLMSIKQGKQADDNCVDGITSNAECRRIILIILKKMAMKEMAKELIF